MIHNKIHLLPISCFPVEWMDVPEDSPVPKRRSIGAARAEGEVIAFVEGTSKELGIG